MKYRQWMCVVLCCFSLNLVAQEVTKSTLPEWRIHPFSVIVSLGYADYQYMMLGDGQTPVGRFAISRDFFSWFAGVFGAELGVESGNYMRLSLSDTDLEILGGLPVQTVMKPMLDILLTLRVTLWEDKPWFFLLKAGGAYRRWQMDREVVNDQSLMEGELQTGFEYAVTDWARLNMVYQGVYGSNPQFTVDSATAISTVHHIPTEQAILLGFVLRF